MILCVLVAGIILSYATSALFTSSFFHEHLPFILMLALLYISCYAGEILFIIALLHAVAMVRYHMINKRTPPEKGATL